MAKSSTSKTQTKEYALDRYQAAVERATEFAERARHAAAENKDYVATAGNVLLVREVARRELVDRKKLEECRAFLRTASWLPEPPSMADVLEQRGYLSNEQIREILSGILQASAKINQAYAALALSLGFATQEQVDECSNALGFDKTTLVLSHELLSHGYITPEQNAAVMKQLRGRTASKAAAAPQ